MTRLAEAVPGRSHQGGWYILEIVKLLPGPVQQVAHGGQTVGQIMAPEVAAAGRVLLRHIGGGAGGILLDDTA